MNKQSLMNRTHPMGRLIWPAVLLLVGPAALAAQGPPDVRPLVIEVENLMADDARHLALAEAGRDPQTLLAGDVVRYRLTFTNTTDDPVRTVEFVDPIPEGLRYVAETAAANREDVLVDFSIDGGRSYSARPVVVEVLDGETIERPAPPERYTHIRWTVTGWVQPGAQVTAQFEATLTARGRPGSDNASGSGSNLNDSSGSPTPEER